MSGSSGKGKRRELLHADDATLAEYAKLFVRHCFKWAGTVGDENHLRSIALYPPSVSRNGEWLVIGKGWSGGYKLVAFHRATDPIVALVGFFQRWSQGKLVWKADTWGDASPPHGAERGDG